MASEWPYPARGLQRSRCCREMPIGRPFRVRRTLGCCAVIGLQRASTAQHSAFAFGGRRADPPPAVRLDPLQVVQKGVEQEKRAQRSSIKSRGRVPNAHVGASPRMQKQGCCKHALAGLCPCSFFSSSRRIEATAPVFQAQETRGARALPAPPAAVIGGRWGLLHGRGMGLRAFWRGLWRVATRDGRASQHRVCLGWRSAVSAARPAPRWRCAGWSGWRPRPIRRAAASG
ncbi:hypothetical protein ACQKWADRAFT_298140 [Trichoderma austrokoningii]